MSLFNSMIQTLSNMAIQEAGVDIPQVANQSLCEDVIQSLRNLPLLNEEESRWDVDMVVVKASNRLGRYLIEAEDLSRFMTTNGIDNAKEAVGYILEANGIGGQFHNVAIVIDEASILEDMEELGYAVSGNLTTPPKGLGLAMIGKQDDFSKIRRIANTKQLMDVLTGRYGLPLIRKNYKQVGLLEAFSSIAEEAKDEDVQMKVCKDDQVIHEEDPKVDKKSRGKFKNEESSDIDDSIKEDRPKGGKGSKGKRDDMENSDKEAEKTEQPGDEDQMQEAAYDQMTTHELQIQRLKDIMAGKIDDEFLY